MTSDTFEDDWAIYRKIAPAAVPRRAEQMATVATLLPFGRSDEFRVADLGCGEGLLSSLIARLYPGARIIGLDGSRAMLEAAGQVLAELGDHHRVVRFDLHEDGWLDEIDGVDAVVSSLAIHHLDHEGKRDLYRKVFERLSEPGSLVVADIIEAPHPAIRLFYADVYDHTAQHQAPELFELFKSAHWNYFRYPDPFDKPSVVYELLRALSDAGFGAVDCPWAYAGHAVHVGYKGDAEVDEPVAYEVALTAAIDVLNR
jgi:tRNA (cmo5U34)-methyltransferase